MNVSFDSARGISRALLTAGRPGGAIACLFSALCFAAVYYDYARTGQAYAFLVGIGIASALFGLPLLLLGAPDRRFVQPPD